MQPVSTRRVIAALILDPPQLSRVVCISPTECWSSALANSRQRRYDDGQSHHRWRRCQLTWETCMDIAAVGPDWGGAHPSKSEALLTSAPCHLTRVLREPPYRGLMGLAAGVGSQSPEPHLEDGSVYRPLRPT